MQPTQRYKLIALDSDEKTLREIAETVSPNFETIRVRNPQLALNLCEDEPLVRVLVTEHVVHPQTGQSLLEVVRLRYPSIRRVMLTTYADLAVIVAGLHTGAFQYLAHKPIQRGELLAAVGQPASVGIYARTSGGSRLSA